MARYKCRPVTYLVITP